MEAPASLPARLYLLTYNPEKERMCRQSYLGYTLRAAALAELFLDGRLVDDGGKVRVAERREPAAAPDPVLDSVLAQIAASARPRPWRHWAGKDTRGTTRAVVDHLEAGRWVRVERRRVLGIFPVDTVTVRERRVAKALAREVRQVLTGTVPTAHVEPRLAALTALASAGELRTVASGRERREHRERISTLSAHAGPAVPALRRVLRDMKAASSAGG